MYRFCCCSSSRKCSVFELFDLQSLLQSTPSLHQTHTHTHTYGPIIITMLSWRSPCSSVSVAHYFCTPLIHLLFSSRLSVHPSVKWSSSRLQPSATVISSLFSFPFSRTCSTKTSQQNHINPPRQTYSNSDKKKEKKKSLEEVMNPLLQCKNAAHNCLLLLYSGVILHYQ